ncbi:MAG: DUF5596 domain-containing protein [Spirochaetia bacterium]|nr:DUF5596 domain-containing protein [Spirochaetia bacterium]
MSQIPALPFNSIQDELGIAPPPELEKIWQLAADVFPFEELASLTEPFIPEKISESSRWLGFPEDLLEALLAEASHFPKNIFWQRLILQEKSFMFFMTLEAFRSRGNWTGIYNAVYEKHPLFYALVLVAEIPRLRALHKARGISEVVSRDTLADILVKVVEDGHGPGKWGLRYNGWLLLHFRQVLFKLHRLQHEMRIFHHPIHVFRNAAGKTAALWEAGKMFRGDGQHADADEYVETENIWTSRFEADGEWITGNPVDPAGKAIREAVRLRIGEWEKVLGRGEGSLGLHIPSTGSLDMEECRKSMEAAPAFFARHFPEFRWNGWECTSWMLDPQLAEHLPASSNLVRFLKEFYLFPLAGANSRQTFERVFGQYPVDLDSAPATTSLQKAVLKHARAGGHWRGGGCFYLPQDLPWGRRVYHGSDLP